LSLLELISFIERTMGLRPTVTHASWRTGDQRYYVSDTRAFETASGWRARVNVEDGLGRLAKWLAEAQEADLPFGQARA
jgi:CDP-paratose 2-epimerase